MGSLGLYTIATTFDSIEKYQEQDWGWTCQGAARRSGTNKYISSILRVINQGLNVETNSCTKNGANLSMRTNRILT